ncbi:MAG: trypsin-like peptidase domain-containing protein [Bacteroidales bacterium]|nr:trypsin-like peptidase domain-containing protein [Bacteroidales bacterium]
MKRTILVSVMAALIGFIDILAQKSDGTQPIGFSLEQKAGYIMPTKTMPAFDVQSMLEEDEMFPYPFRYAKMFDVSINIKKEGVYRVVNKADTLWNVRIESPNAYSISLIFKRFVLPEGAKVYIYNESQTAYMGAFTSVNNKSYKSLAVGDFPGNHIIVEYFEPEKVDGELIIGKVGHAYKDILLDSKSEYAELADEHINVNCLEGKDWVLEKHSVAKITFSGGSCTGAMINNTRNDGTPYFLTANHCISTETEANSVVARFNYENTSCEGSLNYGITLSGATLIATDTMADFTLIRFDESPDSRHAVYYAGWDVEDIGPGRAVGIHHPQGNPKKISIEVDSVRSYSYSTQWTDGHVTQPNTHWEVIFDFGFTESGSSGSPLFNKDKRIVGQLHGGSESDLYGKLSVSWDSGLTSSNKLKPYLDPDNTGVKKIDGYSPVQAPYPEVFNTMKYVCLNSPVEFQDISVYQPTAWEWNFNPASVTFVEGTDKNSKDPIVTFNDTVTYSLNLKVSNANGNNNITFSNLIIADTLIEVAQLPSVLYEICYYSLNRFSVSGFGATDYIWDVDTIGMSKFLSFDILDGNKLQFTYNTNLHITGSLNIPISIVGTHGTCTDTSYFELPVNKQKNDYIANAIPLIYGLNGPFSNKCASKEENEPEPPQGSCNTQMTWCYEGGVQNSVWFTFTGPESGIISIDARGFDDQVAVYEADSFQAILNGDYTLLAANDDYHRKDYWAAIEELHGIIPGKTYWVQVDGSAGGDEGDFTLLLSDQRVGINSSKAEMDEDMFNIFPNPASDVLHVEIYATELQIGNKIRLEVYDNTGKLVTIERIDDIAEFDIDISGFIPGLYYIRCITDSFVSYKTLMKK